MKERLPEDIWLEEGFRAPFKDGLDPYYYICGGRYTDYEIESMSLTELGMRRMRSMPKKIYKYFSNLGDEENNHSIQALKNNTVYLQEAKYFDDNYDCILTMKEEQFARIRIEHYAKLCGIQIEDDWDYEQCLKTYVEYFQKNFDNLDQIKDMFGRDLSDNILDKNCELFALRLEKALINNLNESDVWQRSFYEALHTEYTNMFKVTEKFRIACFTTSPYMIKMWSTYADMHRGFCVEYSIPEISNRNDKLALNLYPVIYSDARNCVLQKCMEEIDAKPNEEYLGAIYKYGILAKNKTLWKEQNEWRLISFDDMLADDHNYNCIFYPISKVYLGQKMQITQRKEIIDICKSKGIPYIGVIQSNEEYKMKDCNGLCENCNRMKG